MITNVFSAPAHDCNRADSSVRRRNYGLVKTGASRKATNRSPSVARNRCDDLHRGPTISCSQWTTGPIKKSARKSVGEHNNDELIETY